MLKAVELLDCTNFLRRLPQRRVLHNDPTFFRESSPHETNQDEYSHSREMR